MAILPREASYEQFCVYVVDLKGPKTQQEMDELWEWRQKLLGIRVDTGRGARGVFPSDEQHLTRAERGRKAEQEALSQGRNIERLPDKAHF
ncbi:hypothetical protein [uncultured Mediterranean phage uvDeep-CGR2-AD7-C12]|nr:hypothetical protein [uncultured Mediterranean phage uvDeep-CGR2-AD7-C12]